MLTFTLLGPNSIRVSGGEMPVVSFPEKPVSGAVNLLASAQEFPSREQISWPGEYDVAGIAIRGIGQLEGQKVSYVAEIDHMRVAFISSPVEAWDDVDLERLGDVHILVLPADDAKLCQKLIDDVDPRMLVLVPTADGVNPEVIKACGATEKEHVSEYKQKGGLSVEGREVVVLGA